MSDRTNFCGGCQERENRLHAFSLAAKETEAQRDRAMALLKSAYCRDCDNSGVLQPDGGPCYWCDERATLLAEQETNHD